MPPAKANDKRKRRKKRKSRTQVSSDSDSESETRESKVDIAEETTVRSGLYPAELDPKPKRDGDVANANSASQKRIPAGPQPLTDAEVSTAFAKFYMQKMATEFSDDLDNLRKAEDFKNDAVTILIDALQQGISLFPMEDQRRMVLAGLEEKGTGTGFVMETESKKPSAD